MMKWEETLADGKWHHFSDVTSIYYAGMAHREGRIERKEEEFVELRADGREVVLTIVMFRLPCGKVKEGDN